METQDAAPHRAQQMVRQTAELLATDLPTDTLFEQLCVLLAKFVDASLVFIALRHGETVRIEYLYDHGVSRRRAAVPVNPRSQTRRVFETGESALFGALEEFPEPPIPLSMNEGASDDGQSMIYVPLRFGARNIGVLSVQSPMRNAYTRADLELLETCALYISVALNSAILESENLQLEQYATHDSLTGVANRRSFDERFGQEWQRAQRTKSTLSLVLLDIDFFKAFNDAYGHIAGDACLKQVAQTAARCVTRPSDVFARYGGEEFAIVLPDTNLGGAITIAERIRSAIEQLGIPHQGSEIGRVTASLGIAACVPAAGAPRESLVSASDKALYFAKSGGRNRVVADSYQSNTPKTARRYAPRHALPSDLTPFIGRTRELDEVCTLLEQSRLVTILGPGGVGKTRLAIAVARAAAAKAADGAVFVDLARIADPALVLPAVANTLGIFEQPGRALRSTMVEALREKMLVLVLDNCEQILGGCADLAESFLQGCADLRVLATSREPLGVPGERTYRLAPFERSDAVKLFCDRAGYDAQEFTRLQPAIGALCERLDNIPLAIELAAARAKDMSLDQLSERLDNRFTVLNKGSRSALPRQRTLRSLIDWSYDLLGEQQRKVLRRISVFAGTITLEAAQEVCGDEDLPACEILDLLGDLTDKSLAVRGRSEDTYTYRLLESTREYAHERLIEAGNEVKLHCRHARYFTKLAARAARDYANMHTGEWLAQLTGQYENCIAALQWCITQRHDIELGAECASSLARFWFESGRAAEGRRWVAQCLAHGEETFVKSVRAGLWHAVDILAMAQGDYAAQLDAARREVALYEELDNPSRIAQAYNGIGVALQSLGEPAEAESYYRRALAIRRELGERRGISVCLENLADLARDYHSDYALAEQLYQEALAIAREIGQDSLIAVALGDLSELEWMRGEYDRAVSLAREGLAIFERFENRPRIAEQLERIARYEISRGNIVQAFGPLADALEIFRQLLHYDGLAQCFDDAFALSLALEKYRSAALLSGFADHLREVHRVPRGPAQRIATENQRSAMLEHLSTGEYAGCFEEGRTWSLQQALEAVAGLRL